MLLLTSISDKLQLVVSAATAVVMNVHCSYADASGTPVAVTLDRKNTRFTTAGGGTIDIAGSPGSGVSRNIKNVKIGNDSAYSNAITLQHTDGSIVVTLESVTLAPGERLGYEEGVGFRVFDAAGSEKIESTVIAGQQVVKRVATDVTNSTTTTAAIADLTTVAGTGTWVFQYFLIVQSAASATGHKLSVNHTGTVSDFVANMRYAAGGTAPGGTALLVSQASQTGVAEQALSARAKATTGWGPTVTLDAAASNVMYVIEGTMVVTAPGNIELWHASEVAAASTVKAGSNLILTKVS